MERALIGLLQIKDMRIEVQKKSTLADGWASAQICDLAHVSSGEFISRADYGQKSGGYPVAGAGGPIGWTDRANFRAPVMTLGRVGAAGSLNVYHSDTWVTDNALV